MNEDGAHHEGGLATVSFLIGSVSDKANGGVNEWPSERETIEKLAVLLRKKKH